MNTKIYAEIGPTLDSAERPRRHDAGRNEARQGGMGAAKRERREGRIQPSRPERTPRTVERKST
jgi:hypothetical protein